MKKNTKIEKLFQKIEELEGNVESKLNEIKKPLDEIQSWRDEIKTLQKKVNDSINDEIDALVGHTYKYVSMFETTYMTVKDYELQPSMLIHDREYLLYGDGFKIHNFCDSANVQKFKYSKKEGKFNTDYIMFNYARDISKLEEISWDDVLKEVGEYVEKNILK